LAAQGLTKLAELVETAVERALKKTPKLAGPEFTTELSSVDLAATDAKYHIAHGLTELLASASARGCLPAEFCLQLNQLWSKAIVVTGILEQEHYQQYPGEFPSPPKTLAESIWWQKRNVINSLAAALHSLGAEAGCWSPK
jgi:hypothetical protein